MRPLYRKQLLLTPPEALLNVLLFLRLITPDNIHVNIFGQRSIIACKCTPHCPLPLHHKCTKVYELYVTWFLIDVTSLLLGALWATWRSVNITHKTRPGRQLLLIQKTTCSVGGLKTLVKLNVLSILNLSIMVKYWQHTKSKYMKFSCNFKYI